ncbi:MAG: hypothetical protein R3B47_04455 [Bacteroidia bacterium]
MIYTTNPAEALHRTMQSDQIQGACQRGSILTTLSGAPIQQKELSKTVHYWSAVQRELEDYFGKRYTKWLT